MDTFLKLCLVAKLFLTSLRHHGLQCTRSPVLCYLPEFAQLHEDLVRHTNKGGRQLLQRFTSTEYLGVQCSGANQNSIYILVSCGFQKKVPLKYQKFIFLQFWRLAVQSESTYKGKFPSKALGEFSSLSSSSSGGSRHSLDCDSFTPVSASMGTLPSSLVSARSPWTISLVGMFASGWRAHLDHPG